MSKSSPLQRIKALNDWLFMFNRTRKRKPKKHKKIDFPIKDEDE